MSSPEGKLTPGERVARARNRKKLTQEELAQRIGKHVTTIQNLERNRFRARRTVEAVARALDTTPEDLGFHFRRALRANDLSPEQRDLIDELLALPAAEQERVRQVLAGLRAKRRGRR